MNYFEIFTSTWNLEPWVLVSSLVLVLFYAYVSGFRSTRRTVLYLVGVALFVLALCSPLDYFGRYYLFSAHMVGHMILLLIVPLFLLWGLSDEDAVRLYRIRAVKNIVKPLSNPILCWFLGIGAMWVWHMPAIHNAVLANIKLYIFQQLSFLVIGILFWLPVFSPFTQHRISTLGSTLYLASACLGCTVLGILITFAGAGLYTFYINPVDTLGILPFLRNDLCLTVGADQQIGGLMMWVPGCLIYLAASMVILARWYSTPESYESKNPYLIKDKEIYNVEYR